MSSEQELSFLQNLLESKEINALVNVHSKVAKVVKDEKFAPIMSGSMQVRFIHFADPPIEIKFNFNKRPPILGCIRSSGTIVATLSHFANMQRPISVTTNAKHSGMLLNFHH